MQILICAICSSLEFISVHVDTADQAAVVVQSSTDDSTTCFTFHVDMESAS
jgi:hypothetical protein